MPFCKSEMHWSHCFACIYPSIHLAQLANREYPAAAVKLSEYILHENNNHFPFTFQFQYWILKFVVDCGFFVLIPIDCGPKREKTNFWLRTLIA